MAKLSLELSDGLYELRGVLLDYTHEPRVLLPEHADALVKSCAMLERRARELECELSKRLWNEEARQERLAGTEAVLAAIRAPGSNVALFPIIPRPFSDGQAGGVA